MDGVMTDGMITGAQWVGRKDSLWEVNLHAVSGRFEWVTAAVNTLPLNFGACSAGNGRFHRTASGECIPDGGAWQFHWKTHGCTQRSVRCRIASKKAAKFLFGI